MPENAAPISFKPIFTNLSGRGVVYHDPPDFAGRSWPVRIHTRGDLAGVGDLLITISRLRRLPLAEPINKAGTGARIGIKTEPLRLSVPFQMKPTTFYGVLQPSGRHYVALIQTLVSVINEPSLDPLATSLRCMAALEEYFLGDEISFAAGVFKPIIELSVAARERLGGGRPGFLFDRKDKEQIGRPKEKHQHDINAVLSLAVHVLILSGNSQEQAMTTVVKLTKKHSLLKENEGDTELQPSAYTRIELGQSYGRFNKGVGPAKGLRAYKILKKKLHTNIQQSIGNKITALKFADELVLACKLNSMVHRRADD